MSQTKSDQILWVDTLKGACILLVVLYHTVLPGFEGTIKYLSAGWVPAEIWIQFNTVLSPLRMPAFFFVSGLLAANGILNRPWKQVFTSRITNIFNSIFCGALFSGGPLLVSPRKLPGSVFHRT